MELGSFGMALGSFGTALDPFRRTEGCTEAEFLLRGGTKRRREAPERSSGAEQNSAGEHPETKRN